MPEPTAQLAARFHAALAKVWTGADFENDAPHGRREHVFDFECGARLVASVRDFGVPHAGVQLVVAVTWPNRPLMPAVSFCGQCVALLASLRVTFVPASWRLSPEGILTLYAPYAGYASGRLQCVICGRRATPTDTLTRWMKWTVVKGIYFTCPAEHPADYGAHADAQARLQQRVDQAIACHEAGTVTCSMPAYAQRHSAIRERGVN